jgi:hypothetical protein
MTDSEARLAELVAEAAAGLVVDGRSEAGGTDYAVGEVVIAEVRGATASFRLRPDVAAAAARTPDAAPSSHGPEWVAFTPRALDRFAGDRVASWFEFAVRQARAGLTYGATVPRQTDGPASSSQGTTTTASEPTATDGVREA